MKVIFALMISLLFGMPNAAIAQNDESALKEYTPPPMFGAPRLSNEKADDNAAKPAKKDKPAKKPSPQYAPRVSKQVVLDDTNKAPIPPRRPKEIVSRALETAETKKVEETSSGVVKGPKTMPAVKADSVETQTISEEEEQTDMMARVQEEKKKERQKEERQQREVKILDTSKPNIIIFEPGLTALNEQQKDALEFAVIPTLKESGARLQIKSFASPANDSFSSDRRISLSRALAVRSFLLERGLDPSKIQLRALGAETNKQPFDRIELIFG